MSAKQFGESKGLKLGEFRAHHVANPYLLELLFHHHSLSGKMPDIPVGEQILDLAFHPVHSTVYTALITGEVKSYTYDENGEHRSGFTERPSKKSCRSLAMDEGGDKLWVAGKSKDI
jgi:hypothetical protein